MKKIIISLCTIAVMTVVAVGATRSYFSDTETSIGNTFSAGTIDIAIDDSNPWTRNYNIGDLKPGETGNINFDIQNVGQNPVNVSKNLSNFSNTGGVEEYPCPALVNNGSGMTSSEPECIAEAQGRVDTVQTQIIYDLSVKVYATNSTSTAPIMEQTIYTDADGRSLTSVYGINGTNYVALGMIPVGGLMTVAQSYHFATSTGNEYQGDTLSFNINLKAEQMTQGACGSSVIGRDGLTYGTVVGADGKCWLDRNLGATRVAVSSTDTASYGDYYQWGRGIDGHQISTSGTTNTQSSNDVPNNGGLFITADTLPYDWRNPKNDTLWQGVSGTNNPCPAGFRLPTQPEWSTLVASIPAITNVATAFSSSLKLPLTGYHNYLSGTIDYQGFGGYYWSSSPDLMVTYFNPSGNTGAKGFIFYSGGVDSAKFEYRALGFSVRCVQN